MPGGLRRGCCSSHAVRVRNVTPTPSWPEAVELQPCGFAIQSYGRLSPSTLHTPPPSVTRFLPESTPGQQPSFAPVLAVVSSGPLAPAWVCKHLSPVCGLPLCDIGSACTVCLVQTLTVRCCGTAEAHSPILWQCRHEYHLQCIMQWAQRSRECPMCFKSLHMQVTMFWTPPCNLQRWVFCTLSFHTHLGQ